MIFEIDIPELFENLSGVYKIENNIDKRVYIGRAHNLKKRAEQHRRRYEKCERNQKINKFIKENPDAVFRFTVISYTDSIVEQEEKEIKKHNSVDDGFNMIYRDDEFLKHKWINNKSKKRKKNKQRALTRLEELTKMLFGKTALKSLDTFSQNIQKKKVKYL